MKFFPAHELFPNVWLKIILLPGDSSVKHKCLATLHPVCCLCLPRLCLEWWSERAQTRMRRPPIHQTLSDFSAFCPSFLLDDKWNWRLDRWPSYPGAQEAQRTNKSISSIFYLMSHQSWPQTRQAFICLLRPRWLWDKRF